MAHWEILAKLNEKANDRDIHSLVKFASHCSRPMSTQSGSTPCA
jgi:hypothetical protein